MPSLVSRAWRRITAAADDVLPMPADDRPEREWTGESSQAESAGRLRRFKLHMLEKRGKGGYR
jgi:hypothetical protein